MTSLKLWHLAAATSLAKAHFKDSHHKTSDCQEFLAKSKPDFCAVSPFPRSLSRTHTGKQTLWLWWCTAPSGLVSPARSSPLLLPVSQGPALGSPASADLSHGLSAGLWSGAELASPPAGRSEACLQLDVMLRPWTWHEELTGLTRQPGNGRRRSLGSGNMPCCPQDRGYVHNACKKS